MSGATATQAIAVTVSAVAAIDGTWNVNGTPPTHTCQTGMTGSYIVAFPAPQITVLVSSSILATASGTGTTMSGSFDSNGKLLVNHTTNNPGGGIFACTHGGNPATLTSQVEALSATFGGPSFFGGTYSLLLNWSDAFCNCSNIFQVTGSK